MARTRSGFSLARRGTSLRRKSAWELGPGNQTQFTISSSQSLIIGAGVSPVVDGLTVVRLRGELLMYLSLATASLDGFSGAFGVGKGSASAFAVGVGSMETPIDDEAWDGWLYHRYFTLRSPVLFSEGAAPGGAAGTSILRVEVDSKAMRKLDIEDVIYAVVQVAETGTSNLRVTFNSRMLVKLA